MKRLQMTSVALALLVVLFSGCARSPQAKRDRYFSRGMALLEKKDYGRAILEFRNATKVISTDPDVYYQMGVAYLGLKDYTNGIYAFRKALELKPNHPQAQLRMAELLSVTDDPGYLKDAQNRLNALLQGNPATPEILNTLGFTELKLGNFESAMQTYERVLAQTPGELTAVVMLARTKLMQKDPQGAEEVLTKAVNGAPQSAAARRILAEFYIERRRMPEAETNLRAALAIDPKDGAALMNLARIELTAGRKQEAEQSFRKLSALASYESVYAVYLFQERRLDEALREFERLAKAKPDDRAARMRLIVAYRKANRPVDAGRVLAEALKKNSKDTDALVQRAEMSLEAAKYTEALADLSLALKLKPDMPEVHYLRAKIYQKRGQLLVYRQELSDTLRLNPALVEVRMEAARDFVTAGDPKGALVLMDAAPEPQKRQPGFIAQRNWALWATGDMAQMRQGVDRGLASQRLPELLVQDGLLRLRSGDAVRARASLEEALKIDPSALIALRILGQTYASEKRLSTGMEKVREYASQQQKSAPVQHFLGMMLLGTGDRTGARAAFQAAKAADKNFVAADLGLAQVDAADGKLDEAKTRLTSVIAADSSNMTAQKWLGNVEAVRGDHNAAITHFRKVLELDPSDSQASNNLAYLLIEYRNEFDEALKYAQKAVELVPDRPAYLDTLGWAHYQKRQYPTAIRYLERASASNQSAAWKYHLAMAYAKAGDLTRGRATLAAAMKQNPRAPEAKAAQEVVGTFK